MEANLLKDLLKRTRVVVLADAEQVQAVCREAFERDFSLSEGMLKERNEVGLFVTDNIAQVESLFCDAPVFLLTDTDITVPFGCADVMSTNVRAEMLRRRAENLVVRLALERQILRDKGNKLRTQSFLQDKGKRESKNLLHRGSFARDFSRSALNAGVHAVLQHARGNQEDKGDVGDVGEKKAKPSATESKPEADEEDQQPEEEEVREYSEEKDIDNVHEGKDDGAEEDKSLAGYSTESEESKDGTEGVDSFSEHTEIEYLRKKSVILQYQLSIQRDDSKRTMDMMRKFHSDITKVSDLLQQYEKLEDNSEGVHLYSAIKEICNVVDKQRFALTDLQVDGNTKRWLDEVFHSGEEVGIALGHEGQQVEDSFEPSSPTPPGILNDPDLPVMQQSQKSVQFASSKSGRGGLLGDALSPTSPKSPVTSPKKHRQSIHFINQGQQVQHSFRRMRSSLGTISLAGEEKSQEEIAEEIFCQDLIKTVQHEEEWDLWRMSELQMMAAANEMLHTFGMVDVFQVKQTAFRNFFSMIARLYKKSNPYHNLYHGFDVMKTCFFFLEIAEFGKDTPNLSGYSLLLAGLCHDVGHPGRSNNFHAQAGSELAIRYNDRSILENYHAALTFRCIRKGNDEMYGNLDAMGRREMRKIIVETILATDVSKHVKLLKAVNDGAVTDHLLQLKLILCCADVLNPIKAPSIADKWTELVNEEFFQQGDEEKRLGMAVSPFCDREQKNSAQLSLNFIDFVVSPIVTALKQAYPAYTKRVEALLDLLAVRRESIKEELEVEKNSSRAAQEEVNKEINKETSESKASEEAETPQAELPPLRTRAHPRPKVPPPMQASGKKPKQRSKQERQMQRVAKAYGLNN